METRPNQSGQQLPRTCYSPLFRPNGNRQIAERVGYTPQWVRIIIHRFNAGGLSGIEWWPYFHGRRGPKQFTDDLVEQIAEVALSPPKKLIGMTQWSLAKLREYLVAQQIIAEISLPWLCCLLRRAGSVGDTPRPGKSRTTRSFGRNTDACGDFTAGGPSAGGGCAWTSSDR